MKETQARKTITRTPCREFYARRDQRTYAYLDEETLIPEPIAVSWTEQVVTTTSGQLLVLSLVNQLARFCRKASFNGPDAPLIAQTPFGGTRLIEAVLTMCRRIDPCGSWGTTPIAQPAYHICVGRGNNAADLYVGSSGWIAYATPTPDEIPAVDELANPLGGAFAACLGAMNAFKASLHLNQRAFQGSLSLWNVGRDHNAQQGPTLRPVQLGDVLLVGAGAVASALAYWMLNLPIQAHWDILDQDTIQLDNTNRSLLFTAADAGWPDTPGLRKADVLARYLRGAIAHSCWFDEFPTQGKRWDLVLPLANERNVRAALLATYPPLMIHATTSSNWQTQLHRHRPDHDRCIVCRLPDTNTPPPACAVGALQTLRPDVHQADAALPFLSAAAGLLVAADLLRLEHSDYGTTYGNLITLDWSGDLRRPTIRQESCDPGCVRWGDPALRRALNQDTRWFALDTRASAS